MDADIGQSVQFDRFLVWLEENWRSIAAIAGAIIVVGIVVAYLLWHGQEQERTASAALSSLLTSREAVSAEALLQLADAQSGTKASARAVLMAAGKLFDAKKYKEAQAAFERFLQAPSAPSLIAEARLGVAACKEAQGDVQGAIAGYQNIVNDPASANVLPQARFALAQLYSEQGQTDLARAQYELLASDRSSSLASEAATRLQEMPPAQSSVPPVAEVGTNLLTNLMSTNLITTNSPPQHGENSPN